MVAVHTLILMKMIHVLLALRRIRLRRKRQKRRHKMWVWDFLKKRLDFGQFNTIFEELRLHDREYFFR